MILNKETKFISNFYFDRILKNKKKSSKKYKNMKHDLKKKQLLKPI